MLKYKESYAKIKKDRKNSPYKHKKRSWILTRAWLRGLGLIKFLYLSSIDYQFWTYIFSINIDNLWLWHAPNSSNNLLESPPKTHTIYHTIRMTNTFDHTEAPPRKSCIVTSCFSNGSTSRNRQRLGSSLNRLGKPL